MVQEVVSCEPFLRCCALVVEQSREDYLVVRKEKSESEVEERGSEREVVCRN